jgi:hypothetical protein
MALNTIGIDLGKTVLVAGGAGRARPSGRTGEAVQPDQAGEVTGNLPPSLIGMEAS